MIYSSTLQRACIYFIYDRDGMIDRYVIDQLKDLRKSVSFIHCVINGKLTDEGKAALESVADEVYVRENKGVDVGAYKAAVHHIGWKKLNQYDELVIMNNTCFGPVYPFKEAFDWAAAQDIDLWGLTVDTKTDWMGTKDYLNYNAKPIHFQSNFIVLRKPLLGSDLLKEFFYKLPEDCTYIQSGSIFEYSFPGYFEEHGYKSAVYCDPEDDRYYPLMHDPVRLLRDYRCPLFKKRSFFHHYTDVLYNTAGEATADLIHFLEEETDYDMNLIWDSILRLNNLADIVRCAQLRRVLPRNVALNSQPTSDMKVGVVYHAFYPDLFDESMEHIRNFPDDVGIFITTTTLKNKAILEQKLKDIGRTGTVAVMENRGRDVSSLLVAAKDFVFNYDLICFGHDKKMQKLLPQSAGRSWVHKLHENTYATREYVNNIIDLFRKESRLGIAFPSYPFHSYFSNNDTYWMGNFENTKLLLDSLGIKVKIDPRSWCVAPLGNCFWFRPEALKKLFAGIDGEGWSYENFPAEPNRCNCTVVHAVERAYAYVAQDAGYYPAFIYNDQYAAIELTGLEFNRAEATQMRVWMDEMVRSSIGLTDSCPVEETMPHNYGIKESLRHLSYALYWRFPGFWTATRPVRQFAKKCYHLIFRR